MKSSIDVDILVFDDGNLNDVVVKRLSHVRGSDSSPALKLENDLAEYHFAWGYPWNAIGDLGDQIGIDNSNRKTVDSTGAFQNAINFLRAYNKKAIVFFDFELNGIDFDEFDLSSIPEWESCKQIAGKSDDMEAVEWFNASRQGLVLATVACCNCKGDFDVFLHSYNVDGGSVDDMPEKLRLLAGRKQIRKATNSLTGAVKPQHSSQAVTNAALQFVKYRKLPEFLNVLLEF